MLSATLGALALLATTAQAATITVGSVLPIKFEPSTFGQVKTLFNTSLPESGANLVSPVNGTIVRWRMQGASGGPYYLRVLRSNGNGAYTAIATSGAATPVGTGVQTFAANIPIQAGDMIGIDPTNATDGIGIATVPSASYAFIFPPPFDGSTIAPSGSESGKEVEVNAEVQPAPGIMAVTPVAGSIAGGDKVTISGNNFSSASSVKFGTLQASFTTVSDTEITAITPPSEKPGTVDITVTTPSGTSADVRSDHFTYLACVVPRLRGKKLGLAKRALRAADCGLGKVKGRRKGKVLKQSPAAGTVLAPESTVSLRLR